MKAVFSRRYALGTDPCGGFQTGKFGEASEVLSSRWKIPIEWIEPKRPSRERLILTHDETYLEKALECRGDSDVFEDLGLALTPSLVEAHLLHCEGTLAACRLAMEDGVGLHIGGGAHHAHRGRGGGFCLFNDIAYALKVLFKEKRVCRAMVVDLDAHQGDGTASIFREDPRVFTFSMHQEDIYPSRKEKSDFDIALPSATRDEAYLSFLKEALERTFSRLRPELVVYLAGADPFEEDRKAGLSLSKRGLRARDNLVFSRCLELGCGVAVVLGGGYAKDPRDTVEIHANTLYEGLLKRRPKS